MRVSSYFLDQSEWRELELEINLIPGLPTLHLLGFASGLSKVLQPQLKAAFLAQEFSWPQTQQVVIQARLNGEKFQRGMELAIAVGILAATGQIQLEGTLHASTFWGEVGLNGEVALPEGSLSLMTESKSSRLVSGKGGSGRELLTLKDLISGAEVIRHCELPRPQRPPLTTRWYSKLAARHLALVAHGEHSILLAGPPGTGKSTWVESLFEMLSEPTPEQWSQIWRLGEIFGEEARFRPFVAPHHSTSSLAILGGGRPPQPGEITRAHGGMLFLDEYLEFSPRVQEALREPIERGEIRLTRGNFCQRFPSNFMLVAATNLCPCGKYVPGKPTGCCYSLARCRSHIDRLSGPMLDRFQAVSLSHEWQGARTQSATNILEQVNGARSLQKNRGQTAKNSQLNLEVLEAQLDPVAKELMPCNEISGRRRLALVRVARSLADLDQTPTIGPAQVLEAQALALDAHHRLL